MYEIKSSKEIILSYLLFFCIVIFIIVIQAVLDDGFKQKQKIQK